MTDDTAPSNAGLRIDRPGLFDSLSYVPRPRQAPSAGEVEIEVCAVGLNFMDVLLALGMLPEPAGGLRFGLECSGRIVACGEGVSGLTVGDPVVALSQDCFSRYVTAPATRVARLPEGLSFADAATIPIAFMTAHYALLELGRLRRDERVLIHAAAGGVGLAAVQLAQLQGAEIFATAGSEEKRAYLRSRGIAHVMSSRTLAFADEILDITSGAGVDVVLNSLSGEFFAKSLAIVSPNGRFLELGKRDLHSDAAISLRALSRGISFSVVGGTAEFPSVQSLLASVFAGHDSGRLRPLPQRLFPSSQTAAAFSLMANAGHIGKIVIALREDAGVIPRLRAAAAPGRQSRSAPTPEAPPTPPAAPFGPRLDLRHSLSPAEGVAAFASILASPHPQIIVSTVPLSSRLASPPAPAAAAKGASPVAASNTTGSALRPEKRAHARPNLSQPFVAPRTSVEKKVAELFQNYLGVEPIGVNDDFDELGGDSLLAVQIIARLRADLGVQLPPQSLLVTPTVAGIAQAVISLQGRKDGAATMTSPLLELRGGTARPALFLIHPVGGSAFIYRDLVSCLPSTQPVYALQAQGLDGQSEPLSTIEAMSEKYLAAILSVQPEGPYALAGASFGGMVAYDLGQRMLAQGRSVGFVAMFDTPSAERLPPPLETDEQILAYILTIHGKRQVSAEQLKRIPESELGALLFSDSGSAKRLFPDADLATMHRYLSVWKASALAMRRYRPQPCQFPLIFFRAMVPDAYNSYQPEGGWFALARGQTELHDAPGNHITMNYLPNTRALATPLAARLAALRTR